MWMYMYVYRPLTHLHCSIYPAKILPVESHLIEVLLAQIENYAMLYCSDALFIYIYCKSCNFTRSFYWVFFFFKFSLIIIL